MSNLLTQIASLLQGNLTNEMIVFISMGIALIIAQFGASYLDSRGKQAALRADFNEIKDQLKKTTIVVSEIQAAISADVWVKQKRWEAKLNLYTKLLPHLYIAKNSISEIITNEQRQGEISLPGHHSDQIQQSDEERSSFNQRRLDEFMKRENEIYNLIGEAALIVSGESYKSLLKYREINQSDFDSYYEYIGTLYSSTEEAYNRLLEEAQSDLELKINPSSH